jgi:hypothetical protein
MRAELVAASRAGIFGIVLIGLCSLLLGLLVQLFSLEPIVYFVSMAGVLFPAVMVTAGMLARWASEDMGIAREHNEAAGRVAASLTGGLVAVLGGALLCILTLMSPLNSVLPVDRLWMLLSGLGAFGYLELAVLFTAYVAMSVIGGMLYDIVVLRPPAR